tara:strand:- start:758 stop:3517 length:2760 start_codon:yes stop_codon:yes gene_type:complete
MIREKVVYWICLLAMMTGTSLFAQRNITEIIVDVTGLGNVTERYVQTNIRLKPGDVYLEGRTNEDVVALMKTGRFEDVQVVTEMVGEDGIKLTFKVRAFPLVTDVKLFLLRRQLSPEDPIGNPALADLMDAEYLAIKESKLLKKLQMIKGQQFNSARMHNDEKLLEEEYRKKGYYPIKVKGQRVGGSVRYIISEGEKFTVERGELKFESANNTELSFSHKELSKIVKIRQRRTWYNPVSWIVDDGRLLPKEYEEDVEKLEKFYRDEGYLDIKVVIGHGADKVLTSPEYETLRTKLFQARANHAQTVEDLDDAERRLENAGADDDERELDRLVDVAEDRLDDAEDVLDDAEDEFEDYLDEADRVAFVFTVDEGPQYLVGNVIIQHGRLVDGEFQPVDPVLFPDFKPVISSDVLGNMLVLRSGEVFRPAALRVDEPENSDLEIIEDAYGHRAYIDASAVVKQSPNLTNNTIDLVFQVIEGDHFFEEEGVQKWERDPINVGLVKIEGNEKTKDFVIRRELAISPGEPFDLGKMENSRGRIEGLRLFESVRATPEYSDRERGSTVENLVVSVKESNTGRFQIGGGFSTDYGAFASVIVAQENFDIMRWRRPYFWQGGGQKVRLRTTAGGDFNNYELDFEEPWLMGKKLRFTTNLYSREMEYYNDKFDVEESGMVLGLERAMFGNDYFRGRVAYTVESIGMVDMKSTASQELLDERGHDLISKIGLGLTLDTRGGGIIPTKGQRSSIDVDFAPGALGSEKEFYGVHIKSGWYFKGVGEGHNIELLSQAATIDSLTGSQKVPYLYRHALGGSRNLRGYDFREVGPRGTAGDYIGGNTMMHVTMEYSVPTLFDMARLATFYDIGVVNKDAYDFSFSGYNDDVGIGLRLEIPFLGPIRLDWAIPLTTDGHNDGGAKFQMNMGYTTNF